MESRDRRGTLVVALCLLCLYPSVGGCPTDGDELDDDDDSTQDPPISGDCAEGMSLVSDPGTGAALFCIDTYEVVVEGELGDTDQYAEGAVVPEAVASSLPGVLPSQMISFGQAQVICANTPVLDADGAQVGFKWLATAEQWRDAADGLPGEGGTFYPYGNEVDPDICVTPDSDGTQVFDAPQPTGSMEGCVSSFGVYDQCGNVFEWVDPQRSIDVQAWLDTADQGQFQVEVGEDASLIVPEDAALERLDVIVVGVPPLELDTDGSGALCAVYEPPDGAPNELPWGYLTLDLHGGSPGQTDPLLPVGLEITDPPDPCPRVLVLEEQDGAPITDKRGGAYYVGDPTVCRVEAFFLEHTHDWNGTIGFRCASEPIGGPGDDRAATIARSSGPL